MEILFAGVGGQGVVLLSKLLSTAYVKKGFHIKTTETIGMAQMGGSVTSHLRIGEDRIYSPFLVEGSADIVFGFEPGEVLRIMKYTNPNTVIVLNEQVIKPVTDSLSSDDYHGGTALKIIRENLKNSYICNFSKLFEEISTDKPMNIALLGVAVGLDILGLSKDEIMEEIEANLPERLLSKNLIAFEYGYEYGITLKGEKK